MLRRIALRSAAVLRSAASPSPLASPSTLRAAAPTYGGDNLPSRQLLWNGLGRRWMSAPAQDGISEKEALDRVMMIVKAHPKVDPSKLTQSSHLINDLGLDSLDVVEIVMGFEEEFMLYIPDEDADKLVSVPAAVDFVAKHPKAR